MQENMSPDQSPCQQKTPKIPKNPLGIMHRLYIIPAISLSCSCNGHYPWLAGCLQNPLHKYPLRPEASSFLLVGYKNRTSVINRRVLNTFNHLTRLQEVSQFHYALFYYYHIYSFTFYFIFFAELLIFPFSIELNSGV